MLQRVEAEEWSVKLDDHGKASTVTHETPGGCEPSPEVLVHKLQFQCDGGCERGRKTAWQASGRLWSGLKLVDMAVISGFHPKNPPWKSQVCTGQWKGELARTRPRS